MFDPSLSACCIRTTLARNSLLLRFGFDEVVFRTNHEPRSIALCTVLLHQPAVEELGPNDQGPKRVIDQISREIIALVKSGAGLKVGVVDLHESINYRRPQFACPEVLISAVRRHHGYGLEVRCCGIFDPSVDTQTGSVLYVSLDAAAINPLIDKRVFPNHSHRSGEIQTPGKCVIAQAVRQEGSDAAEEAGKLHMSAVHLVTKCCGAIGSLITGLSGELGSGESNIGRCLLQSEPEAGFL